MNETQERAKGKEALERYLDHIIEKYTATPRTDPEFLDYAMRPKRKKDGPVVCHEGNGGTLNAAK